MHIGLAHMGEHSRTVPTRLTQKNTRGILEIFAQKIADLFLGNQANLSELHTRPNHPFLLLLTL